ncbi:MAG: NADH-quinone oxidoreductase subunit L [Hyphomicrobiales bacterium]|nr:NADH-quinone oxidoreductase subunit L [Hyphomicrobiales bacterium]
MAQAIVFLPLFGFLIAGLASLIAHRPAREAEVRAFGDADHSGHGGHGHQDHGHQDHGHDDHHAAEPSPHSEGVSRFAEVITTGFLAIACILSWAEFAQVALGSGAAFRVQIADWIHVGGFVADWSLRIDTLTAVMLVVVTSVSMLVHLYSIGYMHEDPARPRFFAYLSLFTFAMLMLVTSDNLVQMFFGWEGVGLASYLLIGFWFKKKSANDAAMKAFIVNRVGDFGFALGIFLTFWLFGAVSFDPIFAGVAGKAKEATVFLGYSVPALELACVLLFMGAMGKSAQFLLHTWLPDAMEGPTPVSALIHAATMVTAGVFMVARLSPLFEHAPVAQSVVLVIGATTAFFAATVGLVQNDIKRVIAYSTCSQLGYMFVALGTGVYAAGIYHLFTHAFFKALLFLGAGSVIHAMHHEQDIRKMGGLARKIPFTAAMMAIGTIALTGFPFTAGFYSKDAIIEAAYVAHQPGHVYAFICVVLAAGMTSFYSWRLFFLTFLGRTRADHHTYEHAHESPLVMLVPLGVLAAGAILAGFPLVGKFIGHDYDAFWKGALFTGANNHTLHDMHDSTKLAAWVPWSPFVMMVAGFVLAYLFYLRWPEIPGRLAARHPTIYRFLLNKWYFDELYDRIFVRPAKALGHFLWKKGDGAMIDGFGPDGVSATVLRVTGRVVRLQTGFVYHYAFAMLLGVAGFVTWYLFAGGAR